VCLNREQQEGSGCVTGEQGKGSERVTAQQGEGSNGMMSVIEKFQNENNTCQSCNDLVKKVFPCTCSVIISCPQHKQSPRPS
jgi:hypothetical protein